MDKLIFDYVVAALGKIGYVATEAWPMMVKYTWAKGIAGVILGVFISLIGLSFLPFAISVYKKDRDYWPMFFAIGLIVFVGIMHFTCYIPDILAPEGATVMDYVRQFKGNR